jgi:predicted ester cyclase
VKQIRQTSYEIRVKGHLTSQWGEWFDGLRIENQPDGEATLLGSFQDQAELFGVLDKVRNLNLELMAVMRIEAVGNSEVENKSIVCRYMEEIINKKNLVACDRYICDQVVFNGGPASREDVISLFELLYHAFPDLQVTIVDQLADKNQVATRVMFRGTHHGDVWGISATGKQVRFNGIAIDRIANDKVVEMWHEADMLGLMKQLRSEH